MAEASVISVLSFDSEGGLGVRLSASTVSSNARIPGQPANNSTVCVTNGGSVSAFFRLGRAGVAADLNCQELLPGTQTVWGIPEDAVQRQLYIAVITESGTTNVQVTLGRGS